jgi:hypothetical protein
MEWSGAREYASRFREEQSGSSPFNPLKSVPLLLGRYEMLPLTGSSCPCKP